MNLYTIKKCKYCPNRVVDLDNLESKLQQVMKDLQFNTRVGAKINLKRPLHHQMFHLALAGCPNSCSQPQIKDFGVQGQARPEVCEGCNTCGACADVCAEAAISMGEEKAIINRNICLNCGQCARVCPTGALQLNNVGFKVLAGGKLGRHPRLATEIMSMANEDEVAKSLVRCAELYINTGCPGERLGSILERTGKELS